MRLEDRLLLATLLERYGGLLSEGQREILTDYCLYDLSLSEIVENRSISRAAVDDAIKKGSKKLEHYEEVLALSKKKERLLALLKEKNYQALEDEIHGI